MYVGDDWPKVQDGIDFDGKHLLTLVRSGNSPFHGVWDVNLLIREIEENLSTQVIDIPRVSKGANNYVRSSCLLSSESDSVLRLRLGGAGFPPEAIESTRRRGAFGLLRCQHAQL